MWWLTRFLTSILLIMPKAKSLRLTKRLLLTPVRRNIVNLPDNVRTEIVETLEGDIRIYRLGTGPIILLSHGWSGAASQLYGLMVKIAQQGYQAVSFDQLGHGISTGKEANLFLFIKSKQQVIEHLEKRQSIELIISHSMGATATLSAIKRPYPLLLIAPIFDFSQALSEKVSQSGVPSKLLKNLLQDLERQYAMSFEYCDPKERLASYRGQVHIVHDRQDQFSSVASSEAMANLHNHVNLTTTSNFGHGRIIDSPATWQVFLNIIKQNKSLQKSM